MKLFLRSFSSLPLIHSRRVVVSYKRKYVHELLVNRLFKSCPRKSVVRYLGRKAKKTTNNQQSVCKGHRQAAKAATKGDTLRVHTRRPVSETSPLDIVYHHSSFYGRRGGQEAIKFNPQYLSVVCFVVLSRWCAC